MIVHTMKQYSDDWWAIREFIPTASAAGRILTPTGRPSAQCDGYIDELLEKMLGLEKKGDRFMSEDMERGRILEPRARAHYQMLHDVEIEEVGFVTNDAATFGASPDGLIDRKVGWECKCPLAKTHIGYFRKGVLPPTYTPQVHMSLAVTGLDKWIFMSYLPELLPLIVTVERDEYTEKMEAAIQHFLDEFEEAKLKMGITDELRRAA